MKYDKTCNLNIYFGLPGSGKSTTAANITKKALKKGVNVFSNVPIKGAFVLEPHVDLGKNDVSNSVIIIDEAGLTYNNRDFKSNFSKGSDNPNELMFWKMYRHYHCQIHLFSQAWDDCDKKIRSLASKYWYVRRSMIPFFVLSIPITKKFAINEMTHEPCDSYSLPHFLIVPFVSKWTFMPFTWNLFNSYDAPVLAAKDFKQW